MIVVRSLPVCGWDRRTTCTAHWTLLVSVLLASMRCSPYRAVATYRQRHKYIRQPSRNLTQSTCLIAMAASSGKSNVTVWRPSVCLSVCLSRRHTRRDSPGAACDTASVHFGLTIRRIDILVCLIFPHNALTLLVGRRK